MSTAILSILSGIGGMFGLMGIIEAGAVAIVNYGVNHRRCNIDYAYSFCLIDRDHNTGHYFFERQSHETSGAWDHNRYCRNNCHCILNSRPIFLPAGSGLNT